MNSIILTNQQDINMNSKKPFWQHKILDKSILEKTISTLEKLRIDKIIVVVDENCDNFKISNNENVIIFSAKKNEKNVLFDNNFFSEDVLILNANMPLLSENTIEKTAMFHLENTGKSTLLTFTNDENLQEPTGFIILGEKFTSKIINLENSLLEMHNSAFLTNFIANEEICTYSFDKTNNSKNELITITDRIKLSSANKYARKIVNNNLMLKGVTLIDPQTTYISDEVQIGADTIVYPNCIIEGKTVIGENCIIGANSSIFNCNILNNVKIESSILHDSKIGNNTTIGPFAYVRPNCTIGDDCKIGDFVEVKNATIGNKTKASHLTYLGDCELGNNINLGCGTITVNYDGKNKFKTIIEDNSFIGCNSNLVAPVVVREGAFVAAGSTITNEIPKNNFAIARARQVNKNDWKQK